MVQNVLRIIQETEKGLEDPEDRGDGVLFSNFVNHQVYCRLWSSIQFLLVFSGVLYSEGNLR
jgi:hypothetical protein